MDLKLRNTIDETHDYVQRSSINFCQKQGEARAVDACYFPMYSIQHAYTEGMSSFSREKQHIQSEAETVKMDFGQSLQSRNEICQNKALQYHSIHSDLVPSQYDRETRSLFNGIAHLDYSVSRVQGSFVKEEPETYGKRNAISYENEEFAGNIEIKISKTKYLQPKNNCFKMNNIATKVGGDKPVECLELITNNEKFKDNKEILICSPDIHLQSKSELSHKTFSCEYCSYTCHKSNDLRRHTFNHTGNKPFSCGQCGLKFNTSYHLKRHHMRHTGEKPFSCDQCEFSCTQLSNLKSHKFRHTGEKPHACDQCNFITSHFNDLKRHKYKHTGERPFVCDVCSFTCGRSYDLKTHKLKHTGEKPFACDQCTFRCTQMGNLKRHKLKHS